MLPLRVFDARLFLRSETIIDGTMPERNDMLEPPPGTEATLARGSFRAGVLLAGLGFLLLAYALITQLQAKPVVIEDVQGASTVVFRAGRDRVLLPFECVTLEWDVENIWGVYLGEDGVVGQDSRAWCIHERGNRPLLRVRFPDDVWREYRFAVRVGAGRLETAAAVICLIVGAYGLQIAPVRWLNRQFRARRSLVTVLMGAWIAGVLLLYWIVLGAPGLQDVMAGAGEFIRGFFRSTYQDL